MVSNNDPKLPGMIRARLREQAAIKGRLDGKTMTKIAEELKVTRVAVSKMLTRALAKLNDETRHGAELYRKIEDRRLDIAMAALVQKVEEGDVEAVRAWVRISESRRRLWGLDAPIELSGPGGGPIPLADETPLARQLSGMLDDHEVAFLRELSRKVQAKIASSPRAALTDGVADHHDPDETKDGDEADD